MSVVGDNIKALRAMFGHDGEDMTQGELADKIGVTRETVNKWETGTIPNLRDSSINKMRKAFHLSVDDLRSESAGLAAQLRGDVSNVSPIHPLKVTAGRRATVPLRTLGRVHAGDPSDEEEVPELVEVPASVALHHSCAFALVVEGDCMDRVVPEGAHILVDPDVEPANGSVAVCELDAGIAVMRRWQRGQSTLMLVADSHSEHDDIVVTLDDRPVKVLGTVVWFQSAGQMS